MRHTKIVVTLGPASREADVVRSLIDAGTDIVRLNFSHGSRDDHAEMYAVVREAATRTGRVVAIMQDLSGPKIRTGTLVDGAPVTLRTGDSIRIGTGDFVGSAERLSVQYAGLAASVGEGDRLLLDDGRIELKVVESDGLEINTQIVAGGRLGEHKGISAPGVTLPDSGLTVKDTEDLTFGLELGVDLVAISFVQSADDLTRARRLVTEAGRPDTFLVAKIERPGAVENLESILDVTDGVMVARGDLGLEMPLERVPGIQKTIARLAQARGVPVIVATQVLESMVHELRPTRAEVGDASTAVDEGVDAIMLAGETAIGRYPVGCVTTLDTIIREAERLSPRPTPPSSGEGRRHEFELCEAAVALATRSEADAIVAVTRAGRTARLLSSLRPRSAIYAVTESEAVARRLTLCRGVRPIVATLAGTVDDHRAIAERHVLAAGYLKPGAIAVFVRVHGELARDDANFLALRRLTEG